MTELCFHFSATVSNAAMAAPVQSLCGCTFSVLWSVYLGVGFLDTLRFKKIHGLSSFGKYKSVFYCQYNSLA